MLSRCTSERYDKLRHDVETYDKVINAELGNEYVELGLFATVINDEICAIQSNRPQVTSDDLRQQVQVLQQANDNFAQRFTGKARAASRSPSPQRWRQLYGSKSRTPFGPNLKVDRLLVRRYMKRHLTKLRIVILEHEAKRHEDERKLMQAEKREIVEAQHRAVAVVEGAKEKIRSEREACEMDLQRKYSQRAADQMKMLEQEVKRQRGLLETAKLELGERFVRWSHKCQRHKHLRNGFDSWLRYAIGRLNGQLRNTLGKFRSRLERRSEVIHQYAVGVRAERLVRSCFAALVHSCHRIQRERAAGRCSALASDNRLLVEQLKARHEDLRRVEWSRKKSLSNFYALQTLQCLRHAFIVWRASREHAKAGRMAKKRRHEVLVTMRAIVDLAATVYPARTFQAWKYFIDKSKDVLAATAAHQRLHCTEQRLTDQLTMTEEQWKRELRITKEGLTDQLERATARLQHSDATMIRLRASRLRATHRWLASVQRLALHSALKAWGALALTFSLRRSHGVKLDTVSVRMHATLRSQVDRAVATLQTVAFKLWCLAYRQRHKGTRAFRRTLDTHLLLEVFRGLHVAVKMIKIERMRQHKRDGDIAARIQTVQWSGMRALVTQWFAVARRRRMVRVTTVNVMGLTHSHSDQCRLVMAFKQWVVHKVTARLDCLVLQAQLAKNNFACLVASNAKRENRLAIFIAFFAWNRELHLVKHERRSMVVEHMETQLKESQRVTAYMRHMVMAQIAFRGAADMHGILNAWRWAVADVRRETEIEATLRSMFEEKKTSKKAAEKKMQLHMIQYNDARDVFLLQSILVAWRQCQQTKKHKEKMIATHVGWAALQASRLGSTDMRIVLLEWKSIAGASKVDRAFQCKLRESVESLTGEMRARQWARLTERLSGLVEHKALKKVYAASYRKISERFSTQCEKKDQTLAAFLSSTDSTNARVFCLSRAFRSWNQTLVHGWRERSTEVIRRAQEKADQLEERVKASIQKRTTALVFGESVATAVFARSCFLAWGSVVASERKQKSMEERYTKELSDMRAQSTHAIKLVQSQMQTYIGSYLSKSSTEADWTLIQHLFQIWKAEVEESQYKKKVQKNMKTLEEHYKNQELSLREEIHKERRSSISQSKKLMSHWFTLDERSVLSKFFATWKHWIHSRRVAGRWTAAHKAVRELSLMTLVFQAWVQTFQTDVKVKELEAGVSRRHAEKLEMNAALMIRILSVKAFQAWADITRKCTKKEADKTRMVNIMKYLSVKTRMGVAKKYFMEWKSLAHSPKLLQDRTVNTQKFLLTLDSRFSSIWSFADFLIIALGFEIWKSFATTNKTKFLSESQSFVHFLEHATHQRRQDKMELFLQKNAKRRDVDCAKETLHTWRRVTSQIALDRSQQNLRALEGFAHSPKTHSYCQTSASAYSPPGSPPSMPKLLSMERIVDEDHDTARRTPDAAPHDRLFRDREPGSGDTSRLLQPRSPQAKYRPYSFSPVPVSPRLRSIRSRTVPAHSSPRDIFSPRSRAVSFSPPQRAADIGIVPSWRCTSSSPLSASGSAFAHPSNCTSAAPICPRNTSSSHTSMVFQHGASAAIPSATPAMSSTAPPLSPAGARTSVADRLRLFGPRAGVAHLGRLSQSLPTADSTKPPPLVDPVLSRTNLLSAPAWPPLLSVSMSRPEPCRRKPPSLPASIRQVGAGERVANGGQCRGASEVREPERTGADMRVRSRGWDDFREIERVERRREAAEDVSERGSQAARERIRQLEAQVRILQGQCDSIEEDVHSTVREVRSHVQRSAHLGATGGSLTDWGTQSWILHQVNRLESTLSPMRRTRQQIDTANKLGKLDLTNA